VKSDNARCRYPGGRDSSADAAPPHRTAEEIQREMEASRRADATRDPRAILSAYARMPTPASLEASRAEIARIESRMVETQRQIDAGQASHAALEELQRQYSAEKVRYEQLIASREPATTGVTGRAPAEDTLASVEKEIVLVKAQISALEQRVTAGRLSSADPELLQLRGELAALQQKAANLRK
jgi:chromosome segregation ATPase